MCTSACWRVAACRGSVFSICIRSCGADTPVRHRLSANAFAVLPVRDAFPRLPLPARAGVPALHYRLLLSIEKLIYGGDGLARTPAGPDGRSMAVFVPFVLPGERVEAELRQEKSGFARATLAQFIEASPERIEPRCPYFGQCGGCHYQHIPYERQLEFKAAILRETLQRIAKIDLKSEIRVHASAPWNYRNRTRFQVKSAPEFALGYFRFGSHEFLPVRECPISSPLINRVQARLLELRGLNCPEAVGELELFADAADERLLAWAYCGREADKKDRS